MPRPPPSIVPCPGIVLYELLTGTLPYCHISDKDQVLQSLIIHQLVLVPWSHGPSLCWCWCHGASADAGSDANPHLQILFMVGCGFLKADMVKLRTDTPKVPQS